MPVSSWDLIPGNNNVAPPNGWPEGMAPSDVNNVGRQMMADVRAFYDDAVLKSAAAFTGSVTLPNGSVSNPAIAFSNDPDCGFYRIGANNLGLALNGVKVVDYGTTTINFVVTNLQQNGNALLSAASSPTCSGTWTFSNPVAVPAGNVGAPGLTVGDADSGLYAGASSGDVNIASNGVIASITNANGVFATGALWAQNTGASAGGGIYAGNGTPNGAVTASVGSIYLRRDGGASTTLYVKESGTATNTGWVAK